MPKVRREKGGGARTGGGGERAGGIVFNKDFGQHILKNPLVVEGIIDKAGLKGTVRAGACGAATAWRDGACRTRCWRLGRALAT